MPYKLRKAPNRDLYWVVDNIGHKYEKEPIPLERAKKQLTALHINTGHGICMSRGRVAPDPIGLEHLRRNPVRREAQRHEPPVDYPPGVDNPHAGVGLAPLPRPEARLVVDRTENERRDIRRLERQMQEDRVLHLHRARPLNLSELRNPNQPKKTGLYLLPGVGLIDLSRGFDPTDVEHRLYIERQLGDPKTYEERIRRPWFMYGSFQDPYSQHGWSDSSGLRRKEALPSDAVVMSTDQGGLETYLFNRFPTDALGEASRITQAEIEAQLGRMALADEIRLLEEGRPRELTDMDYLPEVTDFETVSTQTSGKGMHIKKLHMKRNAEMRGGNFPRAEFNQIRAYLTNPRNVQRLPDETDGEFATRRDAVISEFTAMMNAQQIEYNRTLTSCGGNKLKALIMRLAGEIGRKYRINAFNPEETFQIVNPLARVPAPEPRDPRYAYSLEELRRMPRPAPTPAPAPAPKP